MASGMPCDPRRVTWFLWVSVPSSEEHINLLCGCRKAGEDLPDTGTQQGSYDAGQGEGAIP